MQAEARALVDTVRDAAQRHKLAWDALVPDRFTVNPDAETAEEAAYAEMARAKQALRDHVLATYGVSLDELAYLSAP